MAASIANTYQESFRSTVLPGFERSCTEMMKQVDENFRRGTQDCKSTDIYSDNSIPDSRVVPRHARFIIINKQSEIVDLDPTYQSDSWPTFPYNTYITIKL